MAMAHLAARCCPSGGRTGLASRPAPSFRAGAPRRATRLVPSAAAADVGAAGSGVQDILGELRAGLQEAVKAEDYATAARIRDRISLLEQEDPVVQAEQALAQAIAEQRFEVRCLAAPLAAVVKGSSG